MQSFQASMAEFGIHIPRTVPVPPAPPAPPAPPSRVPPAVPAPPSLRTPPAVPAVPTVPTVPTVPSVPAVPTVPTVVPQLRLVPAVPTLSAATLATVPTPPTIRAPPIPSPNGVAMPPVVPTPPSVAAAPVAPVPVAPAAVAPVAPVAPVEEPPKEPVPEEPKVSDRLTFPRNHLKSILGTQGATIKDIRKGGADVWIKPLEEELEVHMLGTGDQIAAAKKYILKVAAAEEDGGDYRKRKRDDGWEDWGSGNRGWDRGSWGNRDRGDRGGKGGGKRERRGDRQGEGHEEESMDLELSSFGCIVGPGGAKIKEVRANSGAHVSIDKLADKVVVKFSGTSEQVASAKSMIHDLVSGGGQSKGADRSETLMFEGAVMGNIIGTGGKRINDVRKSSGADVQVRKVDDGSCEVAVSGTPDQVEMAKAMVNNFVAAARAGTTPATLDGQPQMW